MTLLETERNDQRSKNQTKKFRTYTFCTDSGGSGKNSAKKKIKWLEVGHLIDKEQQLNIFKK